MGLDIVHSGPDYAGLYAQISSDCVISFRVPYEDSKNTDWSDATWKILDHDQNPKFDASALRGDILPERLEVPYEIRISEYGGVSMEAPIVID